MRKSFKFRLYPNKAVKSSADEILELCRILYNLCLEQRKLAWQYHKKSLSAIDQRNELPVFKKAFPDVKKVPSLTLQEVVERADKAFQGFFRRVKEGERRSGYPRFKSSDRYHSFTLKQSGWNLSAQSLEIAGAGKFKIRLHRPIEGKIKTVTIKHTPTNKWFALFSCDGIPTNPLPKTNQVIGIDMGCEKFLTTSSGDEINNPRFLKTKEVVLKQKQKELSRKAQNSHRREKARLAVAILHEKITNERRDFHFKISNWLVKSFDTIFIEKLRAWNSWRGLNRSMRDAAWFNFFSILKGKAEEAGREVIEVPAKDTTQICSRCGNMVRKILSERRHVCPFCHLSISRDHNAALNILRLGASLRESFSSTPRSLGL